MEVLLLKGNGSEIARKVPSNVTCSTLCFNIHTLISDVLIRGNTLINLTNPLIFFARVDENAIENCFMIIGKSCLSSDAIIFGSNSD